MILSEVRLLSDFSESDNYDYDQYMKEEVKLLVGELCRSGRRRIVNDKELVEMLRKEVDSELIDFAGVTYREQVRDIILLFSPWVLYTNVCRPLRPSLTAPSCLPSFCCLVHMFSYLS